MHAVDTNVLVRLVVGDDEQQTGIAERFVSGGVWVSLPVLLEATWTLDTVYRRDEGEIATVVEMLLKHPAVSLQCSDAVADALQEFRRRPALGFADCLILALAKSSGHLPLGTFDRRLSRLDGTQFLTAGSRSA
jgi:predicted nucleic-acid-binding protein